MLPMADSEDDDVVACATNSNALERGHVGFWKVGSANWLAVHLSSIQIQCCRKGVVLRDEIFNGMGFPRYRGLRSFLHDLDCKASRCASFLARMASQSSDSMLGEVSQCSIYLVLEPLVIFNDIAQRIAHQLRHRGVVVPEHTT